MRPLKVKHTDDFIKDLKELSAKEVSVKYKLCVTSVYRWRKRYGFDVYFTDIVPVDFIEYTKTHNKKEASEYYNTSYATIRKWEWLSDSKCSPKHSIRRNQERNQKIKELHSQYSYSEIGRMFGITKQRVEQIVNEEE